MAEDYPKRIQNFLFCRGIRYIRRSVQPQTHSPLTSCRQAGTETASFTRVGSLLCGNIIIVGTQAKSWKFVDAVWNAKLEPYSDGYFDLYYDGLLILFSIMVSEREYPPDHNTGDEINLRVFGSTSSKLINWHSIKKHWI